MAKFTIHVRLRPIRFGFLVKPHDAKSLLEIFRVNTCLWGGRFNPIIPHLRRVPRWWDRRGHVFKSARQLMNGYLDFFEPDFLVESAPGLSTHLEFDSRRVLRLSEMLQREGNQHTEGQGQSVLALYRDRYRKVFQFALRGAHDIVDVSAEDPSFAPTVACLVGSFSSQDDLAYFDRAFTDAFEPRPVALNGEMLARLYQDGFTSALRLGHSGIDVRVNGWHDPATFVFDALDPRDLIDLWNLRMVRRNLLAVPKQWLPQLSSFCRKVTADNYRSLPNNPNGVMIRNTVMFGRAIPSDAIEAIYDEHLRVDLAGANVRQDWYPRVWERPSSGQGLRESRPVLTAARKTFDPQTTSDESKLRFDCLHPEWCDEYGSDYRWANVVKIDDWSFEDLSATVFPNDRMRAFVPRVGIGGELRLSTTEGVVIFPKFKNIPQYWKAPDGAAAISEWLTANSTVSVASDAGRVTEQIIQTLGGFGHVGDLANRKIIETLDKMSRRPITHSAHYLKFRNQIENAVEGDIGRKRSFATLVDRTAVELGLEVRCEKCSNWSWFALNKLGYQLQCSLCLQSTAFPCAEPGSSEKARWAYRVVGPFALPDYARGGYAAALSLRCIAVAVGGPPERQMTWCAGRELTLIDEPKVEVDFIVWYQRRGMLRDDLSSCTDIVFGEAKSFGKDSFRTEDVANLKAVAQRFPGSVLVFATMRQPGDISASEIRAIRKLALWGREPIEREQQTRAPVVVLTGIELFSGFSLAKTWQEIGGRHAAIGCASRLRTDNLRVLADVTQQLYLEVPSYADWMSAKWDAIHERRRARAEASANQTQGD